jgi:tRNA (guanine37-N1)-methyltransferase
MTINIISIFPDAFKSYFDASIIKRAQEKKLIKINFLNPRDFVVDKHKTVDDKPYGGGPGMVLKAEPILKSVQFLKSKIKNRSAVKGAKCQRQKSKIVLLSPSGRQFTQKMARQWAEKYKNVVLICGRYEGIDERVKKILRADFSAKSSIIVEEISIGSYILTGGELPAMVIVDAVSRHLAGVLGKKESLEEERLSDGGCFRHPKADRKNNRSIIKSFPTYTRPEILEWKGKKYRVPKVLLSGDHKKIDEWRRNKRH